MHWWKSAGMTQKIASMNIEESIRKTTKPLFDAQIGILWYLLSNALYALRLRKGKPLLLKENGGLSIFSIIALFLRSYCIGSNSIFFDGSQNAPVRKFS
ncbi:hypothetical protein MXB_545 [Myxobolus squamalis]|nr:hypothetical protein MXB_545 [Myxobolus squamalis]